MTIFLGIDSGGTKTSCLIGDEAHVLGTGTAAGSNIVRVGTEVARTNIQSAMLRACENAGVAPSDVSRTCIGAAGVSIPAVEAGLQKIIAEVVTGSIEVVGDHAIALEAAFGSDPGVVVTSGTGSIAFGRNALGQTARAGGSGFAISDEGSGHWIGRMAVSRTLRALDARQPTELHHLVVMAWGIQPENLLKTANAIPPPNFAELFPAVVRASQGGDAIATDILAEAALELAELGRIVIERLWTADENVCVSMVGGVFRSSDVIRSQFVDALRKLHPSAAVKTDIAEPLFGALSLARKCAVR